MTARWSKAPGIAGIRRGMKGGFKKEPKKGGCEGREELNEEDPAMGHLELP